MKEIYQVLAGAMGEEARLNQIANNLANVNTPGFKRDAAVFVDVMKMIAPVGGEPQPDISIPNYAEGYVDFTAGAVLETGAPLDLMIDGDGFFEIEGNGGPYYTRAGNFKLDEQGFLITADGKKVLDGFGSEVQIPTDKGLPTIAGNGEIVIGDAMVGKLNVVRFEDPKVLVKHGESLFKAPEGIEPAPDETAQIRQGSLEASNVRPIEEMVRMIETQRAFETHQKMIQAIDETVGKRIEQILNR